MTMEDQVHTNAVQEQAAAVYPDGLIEKGPPKKKRSCRHTHHRT